LRGVCGVTATAKRRQRACRPLRSSPEKTTLRRPTSLRQRKAASCSRSGLAARLLRGLRTEACTHRGPSGNLGGPVVSVEKTRFGLRENKVLANARWCSPCVGAKREHHDGTAERRKRSEAGRAAGSRSVSHTDEAGEPTQGTRRREGDAGIRNCWRERCRRLRTPKPSQRNFNG